ncbi:MAG: hypothetical protein CMJ83_13815 [Planctomycetes bacterium]|nr:hypothetical protein [Planctomycetota bacterium]
MKRLNEAFRDGDEEERIEAMTAAAGLAHPRVVRAIWPGLRSGSTMATRENEELFARLLKSIGRHGSESSIDVLETNDTPETSYRQWANRLLALMDEHHRKL